MSPVAVTGKVPAVLSAKVVEAAEVNDRPGGRHRQGEGLRRGVGVGVGGCDGDRVGARRAEGRRARQGAVGGQGHPGGQVPVSVKVIGVSPVAVTEKVPAVLSAKLVEAAEVNTGAAGRHRQRERLGGGVRVGVGRRDGDRVAARGAGGRRARQGAAGARVTPEGRAPVSVKVIGVSPVAVTEKVPARALGEAWSRQPR